MKRLDRLAWHVLQILAVALVVAGCASPHSRMTWDDTPPVSPVMLHAAVAGPPAALARFHAEMQALFRVTNLEDAYVACLGCDQLANGSATQLDYYYVQSHADRPSFFKQAQTNAAAQGQTVTVTFDANTLRLGSASCPPPGPTTPPGCVPAPYCVATSQCDRYSGPPCQVCRL